MKVWKRSWTFISVVLMALLPLCIMAQVPTTTVQDTVYRADGSPAMGTVVVSWNAFTTATGRAVPAGTTSATIASGGLLTLSLAPNAGSTPMGSYYTAIFHLDDGTTSREYWVIPVAVAGAGPAHLGAIRNQALPASVAMQTVSKQYVDTAIAAAVTGHPLDSSPYVEKAGDTMTGPLVLPADPVSANQAADKNYVDANVAAFTTGLGRKVDELPGATQVVAQPTGTQLKVNNLNGQLYASQYDSAAGNDGPQNALASADCTAGCDVNIERTYTSTSALSTNLIPNKGRVVDERGGAEEITAINPLNPTANGVSSVSLIRDIVTRKATDAKAESPGASEIDAYGLRVLQTATNGGNNVFPSSIEVPPYFKNTYTAAQFAGVYNTSGQHVLTSNETRCYGVGDCLLQNETIVSSGGIRDPADEGAHPHDLLIDEDTQVFTGNCTSGCTTGSTTLQVNALSGAGTQGEGRFLIDKNPARTISAGIITGYMDGAPFGRAEFAGSAFPVSVFLATAAAATSQATDIAPGTVTLPIATTGLSAPYATSTAALSASSGVACVADGHAPGTIGFANFEMANYTVVDGTHLQLTLAKPHISGSTLSFGGLCGYGLEQTVDDFGPLRQVFPVIGSTSATELFYEDAATPIVGHIASNSGYLRQSFTLASLTRSGGVVTAHIAGYFGSFDLNGLALAVAGASDSSFNGTYTVTTTSANTFTYAAPGPDSTATGGTASINNGAYVLYPLAEVLSVYNPANKLVDGTLQLGPNRVAWASGDAVEQPHYYQQNIYPDTLEATQFLPRIEATTRAGVTYKGNVGHTVHGFSVWNQASPSLYVGNGGTRFVPETAYEVLGTWQSVLTAQAGDVSVFQINCNSHGCGRWDSSYALFELYNPLGADVEVYSPQSNTMQYSFGGGIFTFAPTGFTTNTINVGTLNATTITGGIAGSAINSGTISAARLPVFGASGTTHSAGIVPDPGATAGNTRFLREDGVFATPTLAATTGIIGGTALSAGACTTGTVAVSGATIGSVVAVAAGDGSLPPATAVLRAAVTAAGTVTVQICATAAVTPPAVAYNVRVLP